MLRFFGSERVLSYYFVAFNNFKVLMLNKKVFVIK